jgi:hypothetical protein
VTPLFTVYVVGALTRVHRRSGLIGLMAGAAYGVIALVDREFQSLGDIAWLPSSLSNRWAALSISFALTAATMAVVTLLLGRQPADKLLAIYHETGWLQRSREKLPPLREHPFDRPPPRWLRPRWWAAALTVLSAWVVFDLFW